MSVALVAGTANSEKYYWMTSKAPRVAGAEKLILWHCGAGGEQNLWEPLYHTVGNGLVNLYNCLERLAESGYTILACEFGGVASMANTNNQSKISAAITWAAGAPLYCDTAKVGLMGMSMGAMCITRWAAANPAQTAGICGQIPLSDAVWSYNNVPGAPSLFTTAHSPLTWAQIEPIVNPSGAIIAGALGAADIPILWQYATDDTSVGSPATALTFINAVNGAGGNVTGFSMGTGGHTGLPLATVDLDDLVQFFDASFTA